MRVSGLFPKPQNREAFHRSAERFIPERAGCYVLAAPDDTILYVGLSDNINRRFAQHLDSPEKTKPTPYGKAVKFYWLETAQTEKLERSWLNCHMDMEGKLPPLNKQHSPLSM